MMNCDANDCPWFQPGVLSQDLVTIPVEAALVTAISYGITPPQTPRWPFSDEQANGRRNPSRQPGALGVAMGASIMVPLVAKLADANPRFHVWRQMRGAIHAHFLTELLTVSAKTGFGRKRPFYDTVAAVGDNRTDDRMSFFSGHASHSFAFSTYGSYIAQHYLDNKSLAWCFTGLFYSSAIWMTASRAVDGQHNWSDVAVGAGVGTAVAYFIAQRVANLSSQESISLTAAPGVLGLRIRF